MMTEYVQQITCRREFVKKQSKLGNQKKSKCTYDVYNFLQLHDFFIILKKLTYFLKFSLHRVFFRLFLLVCVFLRSYFLTRRTPYSGQKQTKQFPQRVGECTTLLPANWHLPIFLRRKGELVLQIDKSRLRGAAPKKRSGKNGGG